MSEAPYRDLLEEAREGWEGVRHGVIEEDADGSRGRCRR
jgi:hypothetical protein